MKAGLRMGAITVAITTTILLTSIRIPIFALIYGTVAMGFLLASILLASGVIEKRTLLFWSLNWPAILIIYVYHRISRKSRELREFVEHHSINPEKIKTAIETHLRTELGLNMPVTVRITYNDKPEVEIVADYPDARTIESVVQFVSETFSIPRNNISIDFPNTRNTV